MKYLKEQKVNSALGILIICLFAVIFLAIGYYSIDNELHKFGNSYYRLYVHRK